MPASFVCFAEYVPCMARDWQRCQGKCGCALQDAAIKDLQDGRSVPKTISDLPEDLKRYEVLPSGFEPEITALRGQYA